MGTGTQGDLYGRTAVAMMFGGLASQASGGSFEDGAMTALFVHLFNDRGRNRRTDKMIIYTFKGSEAHAAMEIANKDGTERTLWDPNGDYERHNRGELQLFKNIAKGEYVSYWNKEGETVYVQTISIDEVEYFSLDERIGGEIGFFDCAFSTSVVIAGLPRFKDLDWVLFPGSLRNYFENLNYPAVKHSPEIMHD